MRFLFGLVLLLSAGTGVGCSVASFDPDSLVENAPVYSANGRYCVIVRLHPVADFTSERAGTLFGLDDPDAVTPAPQAVTGDPNTIPAALYETSPARRLLAEFKMSADTVAEVLVSDSGRYVVGVQPLAGGCRGWSEPSDSYLAIYRADGGASRVVKVSDVITARDLWFLHDKDLSIRHAVAAVDSTREVVTLAIPKPARSGEPELETRRVELATGALLDELRDLFPQPRAYATPFNGEAQGTDPAVVHVASAELFQRAVAGPLPEFPMVALRARIRGLTVIEVTVSDRGTVVSTRAVKALPFGITEAAVDAAKRWLFRPLVVDGKRVPFRSEIVFHFVDTDEQTWNEAVRHAPPQQ